MEERDYGYIVVSSIIS